MPITPIQTRYAGYLFRSRLEARWAVFFDTIRKNQLEYLKTIPEILRAHGEDAPVRPRVGGKLVPLKWEYEPEGFTLPSGKLYLPDFKISLFDGDTLWCEIKPKGQCSPELEEFIASGRKDWHGTVLREIPDPRLDPNQWWESVEKWFGPAEDMKEGWWDNFHGFCICRLCAAHGFEFQGSKEDRIGCGHKGYSSASIRHALAAARAAHFEHDQREVY
jgi:hypothetical protein